MLLVHSIKIPHTLSNLDSFAAIYTIASTFFLFTCNRLGNVPKIFYRWLTIFWGHTPLEMGVSFEGFSEEAKSSLLDYQYPGNVRELRNIVECSATLCPPEVSLIGAEHINIQKGVSAKLLSQSDQLAGKNEYEWILQVLEENRWNRRQTAKKLGIPYSTLRFKMGKLGIS